MLTIFAYQWEEELAIQVADSVPVGWDIMKQLACRLDLESPFQIVLYLIRTAAILSPVRASGPHITLMDLEICYLVQAHRFQQPSTINPSDSTL